MSLAASHTEPPLSRFEFSEPHMGTTFAIVLYAHDAALARGAARAAFERIAQLDAMLSDYRDDSEAMKLTRDGVGHPVPVSEDLFRVLSVAQAMSERTAGAFDVTVGRLTRLWRRARRQGELPDPREVASARQASGWTLVRLDARSRTVTVAAPDMRLDFGGIAKGYAADRAMETLGAAGVSHVLVAAGGDVAAAEPPPGEKGWHIHIAPFDRRDPLPTGPLTLTQAGASTSGDAEQWVEIGGVRYSHILDPRTGAPLTGHRQVTAVAPDATTSDMLATTLCVLGPRGGLRLSDEMPGTAALMGVAAPDGIVRWTYSRRWPAVAGRPH